LAFPAALALDLLLGDPHFLPHPVRWMGRAITRFEPAFRKLPLPLVFSGSLFAVSLVALSWLSGFFLVRLSAAIHPALALVVETVLLYYCLAVRSLHSSAMAVFHALEGGSLEAARGKLAMIVGRDVTGLDPAGISRAAVETVAENLVDGIFSPLFYAVVGGAPLCLAFKMISTLDSMVGYKNERYHLFGKAGARMDDVANFIPARLCVPLIALCARLLSGRGRDALTCAVADGRRHASPNSGFPEAAFAGALSIRLGGPNRYHGQWVEKPHIGDRFPEAKPFHIPRACGLMVLTSLIGFSLLWAWLILQGGALL
jgi:adenosylcobinamide-phosphate synthase